MNIQKTYNDFESIIKKWETALDNHTIEELQKKENQDSWSVGQVYIHLINSALEFHFKQIDICLQTNENQNQKKNFKGFLAYRLLNGFPPIKIKVPPSDAYTPKQPVSITEIKEGLKAVKQKMSKTIPLLNQSTKKGKTAHPGFNYLNAEEWYKLIVMHYKHHLRQRETIVAFLNQ